MFLKNCGGQSTAVDTKYKKLEFREEEEKKVGKIRWKNKGKMKSEQMTSAAEETERVDESYEFSLLFGFAERPSDTKWARL